FANNEFMPPLDELKRELEMSVTDEDGLSNVKVQEKKDKIIATVDFKNLSALDSSAYEIPVADLVILEDDILEEVILTKGTKEFTEKSSAIFVRVPSDAAEFTTAQIIVPGKVVAHSEGVTIEKNDTVSFNDSGYTYFVYEP